MQEYEGIFIFDADVSSETAKKLTKAVSELITKKSGKIEEVQEWARRKLGHPIKRKRDGFLVMIRFKLQSESLTHLHKQICLNDEILKFMITRKTEFRPLKIRKRTPQKPQQVVA